MDTERFEDRFNNLLDKYLSVVNEEITSFEKEKSLTIENYAFNLSHKIMDVIKENYRFKVDISVISDGIISDSNKVIINYNNKYKDEIIEFTKIEDIFMMDLDNRQKCKNILDYLNGLKDSYLLEENFVSNVNEIFAKRIMTRILNTKVEITKDESVRLLNIIYSLVKSETFGFINDLNNCYVKVCSNVSTISHKLSEAMAQMVLLKPYLTLENENTRVSRYSNIEEEEMDSDDMNEKGFTLVELLAVIVILSIIAIVTSTVVFKLVSNSRTKIYDSNIALIEKSSEKWAIDHNDLVGTTTPYCLNINELVTGGYISRDTLNDPRETKTVKIEGYVKISYDADYKQYDYKYVGSECN